MTDPSPDQVDTIPESDWSWPVQIRWVDGRLEIRVLHCQGMSGAYYIESDQPATYHVTNPPHLQEPPDG